ncbi:hypothetical protein MGN70_004568 [Eutypa lata]|nr:hypothetical protein MGN70_004568 [Eutypa lata]
MAHHQGFLRFARAIYEFTPGFAVNSPSSFFHPLRCCIEDHPSLGVVVHDTHTDKAFYQKVPSIDLENHISIFEGLDNENNKLLAIEKVLGSDLDRSFIRDIPPWRVIVLPLGPSRCFIAFSYSHMIGDGPTGTAFHHTFFNACDDVPTVPSSSKVVKTSIKPLPAPFDTPQRLPISWSFLLAPLIDSFLPRFVSEFLGLQLAIYPLDTGTWTGSLVPRNPKTPQSKIKLREIKAPLLEKALRASRAHKAKLTGTFQQLVIRALSKAFPDPAITNFVAQTAISMRQAIGVPSNVMGNFVSGCYINYPRVDPFRPIADEDWKSASSATQRLAESAATLQDQPIGLLRYVPRMRKWTLEKLGRKRECSFEVSNVGVFDNHQDLPSGKVPKTRITEIFFAQPGHILSTPLAFNLASLKGDSFVYTVTWQPGALGVPEDVEDALVEEICSSIDAEFGMLE